MISKYNQYTEYRYSNTLINIKQSVDEMELTGLDMAGGDSKKSSHDNSDQPNKDASVSKDLASIRRRRANDKGKRFPTQVEDFVLILGFVYGALFALLLFSMSSGVFGDSTWMDHAASQTLLDRGDECNEISETPWVHLYTDNDNEAIAIGGYNLDQGLAFVNSSFFEVVDENTERFELKQEENMTVSTSGTVETSVSFHDLDEATYRLEVSISVDKSTDDGEQGEIATNSIVFKLENTSSPLSGLPMISDESHLEAHVIESGVRNCWTMTELGNWGFVLMGAELGGGRETAMLSGGAAGIPAWWMAYISLSLSVVSLFLLYPLMYKVYHQDTDDMLSRHHITQLVLETVEKSATRLKIDVDWELFKVDPRDLSVDIIVPYKDTDDTLSDHMDVRAEVLREILEEFAIFRVFKPVQLTVRSIGSDSGAIDFDSGIGVGRSEKADLSKGMDYTSFFDDLHTLSSIEDNVREALDKYFSNKPNLTMVGCIVTSDDRNVLVNLIFKPNTRFAFFRFKETAVDIQNNLHEFLTKEIPDLFDRQQLVMKVRNQVSTLADRSGAGRVESDKKSKDRVAAIAKQDGLGGRVLQTKFVGNLLSTVEYTANEKRDMINKYGFWGLIGFVWIPFMASGVIVGSMLGMLSRMKFMRVLWAVLVGGTAASVTWAYTAEGIIRFMHAYRLEAFIPIAICVFVLLAVIHMRTTKNRRQAELFEDTLLENFHEEFSSKYGTE